MLQHGINQDVVNRSASKDFLVSEGDGMQDKQGQDIEPACKEKRCLSLSSCNEHLKYRYLKLERWSCP